MRESRFIFSESREIEIDPHTFDECDDLSALISRKTFWDQHDSEQFRENSDW